MLGKLGNVSFGSDAGKRFNDFQQKDGMVPLIVQDKKLGVSEKEKFFDKYCKEVDFFVKTAKMPLDKEDYGALFQAITDTYLTTCVSLDPKFKSYNLSSNITKKAIDANDKLLELSNKNYYGEDYHK